MYANLVPMESRLTALPEGDPGKEVNLHMHATRTFVYSRCQRPVKGRDQIVNTKRIFSTKKPALNYSAWPRHPINDLFKIGFWCFIFFF